MTAHELTHFFTDELHICGCGIPEAAGILVRDILRLAPFYDHREELKQLLPTDGLFYLVLGQLEDADLIEHGGNIGGSWLTDEGQEIRDSLNVISETDPELETIWPDGFVQPPADCEKCYPSGPRP